MVDSLQAEQSRFVRVPEILGFGMMRPHFAQVLIPSLPLVPLLLPPLLFSVWFSFNFILVAFQVGVRQVVHQGAEA